ncbi:hypothetical protein Bbelb_003400 [Branchiostoma belcheri]|nr:hypothetical protein Bbelb_003400 [Branchiostoma belcheri]
MPAERESTTPHSHVPYGAEGSGFYSDNTIGCYNVIQASIPNVMDAINSMNLDTGRTFTIADYGTADGGTSMPMLYQVIKFLRAKYGDALPIHVAYEDQPVNDFKSLFLRLQGLLPMPENNSYFKDFANTYVTACGTSFYAQSYPPNFVDLGFSATAMHWLQKKPCNLTDALHHTSAGVPQEKQLFAAQAALDWEQNLMHRAKELAPGGHLVIVNFCVDEKGRYLGNTDKKQSMFERMTSLWRKLVEEGTITQEEFVNTTFINYYRSVEEVSAPFKDESSPVRKAGLSLVSVETKVTECPYWARWMREGGDAKVHAKRFIPTTRTWSNHTFLSGLSDSRSAAEKAAIVDKFFGMYEAEVAAAPADHGMGYVHTFIHIKKDN